MQIKGPRNGKNLLYKKIHNMWYKMMQRCYNKENPFYINYGLKGVHVHKNWHSFENFIETVDSVEGFDINELLDGNISLDKDSFSTNNKLYSVETCRFISKNENNSIKPNQQTEIVGISPEGSVYQFRNQSWFAKEHKLRQSSISECLTGRLKTHRKWKFYYKN